MTRVGRWAELGLLSSPRASEVSHDHRGQCLWLTSRALLRQEPAEQSTEHLWIGPREADEVFDPSELVHRLKKRIGDGLPADSFPRALRAERIHWLGSSGGEATVPTR